MTGETLLPCPWCGGHLSITKHFRDELWQGIHRCTVVGAITFDWRSSEGEIIALWNTRALVPALDTVLEAVEAGSLSAESVERFRIQISGAYWTDEEMLADFATALRALRAEQSAEAGGERGGDS